jgi:hypothetical protein
MMATGTSQSGKIDGTRQRQKRGPAAMSQKSKLGLLLLLLIAFLWVLFNFGGVQAQAQLGASYASHIACSCRYIEGRPLDACYKDFEPGMGMVSLTDDPNNKRVTASVPLLAHAVAERRGDFGCQQLNEQEIEKLD